MRPTIGSHFYFSYISHIKYIRMLIVRYFFKFSLDNYRMGFFYIHKISPYLHIMRCTVFKLGEALKCEAKGERNGGRHLSDVS